MSSQKITRRSASNDPVTLVHPPAENTRKPRKDKPVESLAIEDDDFGGDPYNHTGSHAVPDFGQDD
jgi:hypothetical protein